MGSNQVGPSKWDNRIESGMLESRGPYLDENTSDSNLDRELDQRKRCHEQRKDDCLSLVVCTVSLQVGSRISIALSRPDPETYQRNSLREPISPLIHPREVRYDTIDRLVCTARERERRSQTADKYSEIRGNDRWVGWKRAWIPGGPVSPFALSLDSRGEKRTWNRFRADLGPRLIAPVDLSAAKWPEV